MLSNKALYRLMVKGWKEQKRGFAKFAFWRSQSGDPLAEHHQVVSCCALGAAAYAAGASDPSTWAIYNVSGKHWTNIADLSNSCKTKGEAMRKVRQYLNV